MDTTISNRNRPLASQLHRAYMLVEQRDVLRARDRLRYRQRRDSLSEQQLNAYRQRRREQHQIRMQNMSADQRAECLTRRRILYQNHQRR
ncbi:hypothetical protein FRX31_026934 [Thalictrum thalictroides]|uniref:Uncharacterized protein n=1 Tax=Thalictrum thalictroides TaxID=46969 RepID=A0A7J6VFX0_THATH|nr:hypothetical protein FRX31_026934 [Thalictrum thalictroides]